jgi:hypothetical protein
MKRKIIFKDFISKYDLIKNKDKIFLFGDNDMRYGLGGQAREMRGEPNALGIRTKKAPSLKEGSFYSDDEYNENIKKINEDFLKIPDNKDIVIPEKGLGTGLAMLDIKAPKTFEYLQNKIMELKGNKDVKSI